MNDPYSWEALDQLSLPQLQLLLNRTQQVWATRYAQAGARFIQLPVSIGSSHRVELVKAVHRATQGSGLKEALALVNEGGTVPDLGDPACEVLKDLVRRINEEKNREK